MKITFGAFLLVVVAGLVSAAEITIPRFEAATLGRTENGAFGLASAVSADLAITGGYKYGIALGFSFDAGDLPSTPGTFNFRMVKATARDLFNLPLEMTYFLGEGDDFCSGDEFTARFGYEPIGTAFRGLFYFPSGIGGDITRQYHGVYGVRGTGLSFALTGWDAFIPMAYMYMKDGRFFSADLRFILDRDVFKLEAFGGVSLEDTAILRGGILAHFSRENIAFLFQGGLSGWKTSGDLTIDNFYFLMEPRLRFGLLGITAAFFYHPAMYNNITTEAERGKADINLKVYTRIPGGGLSVGIEAGMDIKVDKMEDFAMGIGPFASFVSGGFQWDAKLNFNLLGPDAPEERCELFVGVTSSF